MKTMREQYLENAEKYALAYKTIFEDNVEGNEYKKFSRMETAAAKKCQAIFLTLRDSNRLSEIEDLMLHSNPYVRYISAAHGLYSNPQLAEKTLEELIETDGHKIRMHALSTLKAWRNIPWTEDRYK
jgi:hypothetical protein